MGQSPYGRPPILVDLSRDRHGVLEANAGTGKTHVLAHLFVDLLRSTPCGVEQILAVTFTERALVELRERVRQLLEAAKSERQLCAPQRRKLETALLSFSFAPICTIHSFCHQLILEFSAEPFDSQCLELVDSRRAFHRAFRAFLREHVALEGRFDPLLDAWFAEHDAGQLEALLFAAQRAGYLESGAMADHRAACLDVLQPGDIEHLKQEYTEAALETQARDDAIRALETLAALLAASLGDVEALSARLAAFDFSRLLEPRRAAARGGKKKFPDEMSPRAKAFLYAAKRAQAATRIEVRAVDAFLPKIAERLEKEKRERGRLDYDDMLRWAWRMLDGPRSEQILAALRARLRYGLVDEFQDTDEIQWKILRRIFVESKSGNVLYLIGDPKQAIYAFRGADVYTYLAAVDELAAKGAPLVRLVDNFRSTPLMVQALNEILDQSAPEPLFTGEINYRVPSRSARPKFQAVDCQGLPLKPVTLMRLAPTEQKGGFVSRARRALGRHLAQRLRRILFEPDHEFRLVQEDDMPRRISAEEIFVLTRTVEESLEVGSYLQEAGVPFTFYKLDGLFQTDEARDVLDLLRAVERPAVRAYRLKAYLTPFFGLGLNDLPLDDVSEQPFYEMLVEWNALAERELLGELFDRVLYKSGLVARELLLSTSRRRLTNYEQIFETLLEQSFANKLPLSDLVLALEDYIAGGAFSPGAEQNLQRPESVGAAVRILTVHKSKGLEAKIVILFGGFYAPPDDSPIARYHEQRQCRFAIGKAAKDLVKEALRRERAEEDQRLLYVAITRACAKLYLPFFPDDALKKPLNGYYAALNRRLCAMASRAQLREDLFAVEDVSDGEGARVDESCARQPGDALSLASLPAAERGSSKATTPGEDPVAEAREIEASIEDDKEPRTGTNLRLGSDSSRHPLRWVPPEGLLDDEGESSRLRAKLAELRARHAAPAVRSYTSLNRYAETEPHSAAADYAVQIVPWGASHAAVGELIASREIGIFLHALLRDVDLRSLAEAADFDAWKNRADLRDIVRSAVRRGWGVDEAAAEPAMRLVYRALRWSFRPVGAQAAGELHELVKQREMEFLFPIFELSGPLLRSAESPAGCSTRPIYFRGFIDLVFEHQGLVYFADWKSDSLASYEPEALAAHVRRYYQWQIKIYALAVVRLLNIRSATEYEKRFGGLFYLFLRGLCDATTGSQSGLYRCLPSWTDIRRWEGELARGE